MIDWIVLLTPLAVLPIVVLFAFIGCTNNYDQFREHHDNGQSKVNGVPLVRLRYGPGFEHGVESLDVRFLYEPDHKPEVEVAPHEPLTQFDSTGGVVDRTGEANLGQAANGWLSCHCAVKLPEQEAPIDYHVGRQRNDGKQELGTFVFSRDFAGKVDP
jgi:hypothetical protein